MLLRDGHARKLTVLVGSGRNWYEATRFPHTREDSGESTGEEALDRWVRQRAAEELIRLAASTEVSRGGRRTTEDLW